jgi:hypothetical protein
MRVWIARFLIGVVFLLNVQCAVLFWTQPERYALAYELFGDIGIATVRGFAVLFLMWNVPYVLAFWHPVKNRLSLWEAVIMQSIGLVGETAILQSVPIEHAILRSSINRFIGFDGLGLILLLISAGFSYFSGSKKP